MKPLYRMLLVLFLLSPLAPYPSPLVHAGPSQVGGRQSPDATEQIQLDLPGQEHMKNASGTDGSGLCVFTSIEIAAHWQNVEQLRGFQKEMTQEKGGGWPDKVDEMMKKYAPSVQYIQYSGNDPSIIKLALKTGRMVGVTYGYSPRYKSKISHMVDCVHMTDKWAAVLDNNFPGDDKYEWMAPEEFLSRWKDSSGGWAIVLLSGNPPPPIPVNRGYQPTDPAPLSPKPCPGPGPCPSCSAARSCGLAHSDDCCCSCDKNCHCACKCKCAEKRKKCCPGCMCVKVERPPHYPQMPICWRCHYNAQQLVGIFPFSPLFPNIHRPHPRPRPVYGDEDEPDFSLLLQLVFRLDIVRKHQDFGVSSDKLPAAEEHYYSFCGTRITALEAFRLIEKGGTLNDDSNKPRLTIVAAPDQIAAILKDFETSPSLLPYKDKLLISAYPTQHWAITGVGLPNDGKPTIILQAPPDGQGRGIVLHVQRDYSDGAEGLAKAIRKADPSYDPKKDRDLRADDCPDCPSTPGSSSNCCVQWTLWSVIMLGLRLLIPDIVYGVQWIATKMIGSIKSHASQELAVLKAELAALKQNKPAAP